MAHGVDAGLLECDFCKHVFSIRDENFPPDLYRLMVKYDISQLIWICAPCKQKKERNFIYFLSLAERQREMERTLNSMAVAINEIQSTIQLNKSDSSIPDKSLSTDSGFERNFQSTPFCRNLMRVISDPVVPKREDQLNFQEMATRNDWAFVYENSEDVSVCSFDSTTFSGSISSASTVKTINNVQYDNDVAKSSNAASSSCEFKKKGLGILKAILSEKIKIDPCETKQNKAILNDFLDKLSRTLKEGSAEFRQLFQRPYYTGSSYEELRIGKADEFDINLVLQFPQQANALKVEFPDEYPSFARCVFANQPYENNAQLLKLFFEDGCLVPAKVRSWMQSLISKFITVPSFVKPAEVIKIEPCQSGPASTMKLTTVHGCTIDIDLVPVFQFTDSNWPPHCDTSSLGDFTLSKDDKFWFLVPKPFISKEKQVPEICSQLWRVHLPGVEKRFLHGRNCVKPLIKLLKLLRDKENWKILASYYLKTVLMWEIRIHPDVLYWSEALMGERFLEVVKKLDEYVKDGRLPHFLFPMVNLLVKMKGSHSGNIHGRLQHIIKEIEKDTLNLYSVFGVAVEPPS